MAFAEYPAEVIFGDGSTSDAGVGWEALEDTRRRCFTTYHKVVFGFGACVVCCSMISLGALLAPVLKTFFMKVLPMMV